MAKFLSALMTKGAGKIGGMVITFNRYSPLVLRANTQPVNPNTPGQISSRAAFKTSVVDWKGLTFGVRQQWKGWANTVIKTGSLGNQYNPSGFNMFMSASSFIKFLFNNGHLPIDSVEIPLTPGAVRDPYVAVLPATTVGVTGINVRITNPNEAESLEIFYYINISESVSLGREFYKGPFPHAGAQIVSVPAGGFEDVEIGDLIEGASYWVKVRGVAVAAGSSQRSKVSNAIIGNGIAVTGGP